MNRRVFVLPAVLLVMGGLPTKAAAQNNVDIAGGYSFNRITSDCSSDCNFPKGWFATVGVNVMPKMPMVDIVGDVSGAYKTVTFATLGVSASASEKVYTYMGGPRVRWADGMMPVTVWGQFLVGGSSFSASGGGQSQSNNNFALSPGGGVDVKINDMWSGRVGVNYRLIKPTDSGDSWSKVVQVGIGAVYNWKP